MGGEDPATSGRDEEVVRGQLAGRFDALFRTHAVGIIELAPDGTFLTVNDTYCQITGYSRDELREMRVFDMSWPEDRERHQSALDPFLRGETPVYRAEKRYRRNDGSSVWVDVSGSTLYDEGHQTVRTVNIVQDVTERHRAEVALRDSLQRLEMAKRAAGLGIYDWDTVQDRMSWDDRLRAWSGVESDVIVDWKAFVSTFHEKDRPLVESALHAAFLPAGGGTFEVQVRMVSRADRRERWVAVTGCVTFSGGRPVRVVGTVRDITDRKQAELTLWEREERFRALVEPFAQAVWETDAEGKASADSPSWRAYTGQTLEEWLGDGWVHAVHPEDQEFAQQRWSEALHTRTAMSTVFRLRGPNGEWRWTNVRAAPLLNPDGSIRKWVGMNVDVSDRIKAEQARRESEAKYRALFESMDEGFVLADVLFDGDRATDVLYLALNPPAVRMMGQDCTALRMQQIQPGPGFGPDWLESLGQVARTGHPIRVQHYAKPLDAWFECHAFRVGPEDLPRIGVVFEDITARMRREAQQRAAAARDTFRVRLADALRRLADPMQIQSTAATLLGQHLGVARVAYKESEDEHVIVHVEYAHDVPAATGRYHLPDFGQNLFADLRAGRTLVVSDVNEATLTDAERAMYRSERVGAHITVPLIKDGTLIAVLSVQHPTPRAWTDDERTLVEEVAERTWDAVERARSEQALIEKDRRLRAALSAAHMGTWLWDVRTDTQVIDENLQQLMGVARVPSKGSLDQFLRAVAPEDRGLVRKAFARSVEDGSGLDLEFRVRSNGQVHWLRERGEVVRDPEGRALYVTGACVDITDRKAMEEELRLAARRKDEFLAVLSHELRNPLAPIRNSVYVLERAAPGGEQAVRARQIIDRQARHLTRLIEDLLDVTRIARGKVSLQRQRVDLNELVRKTAEDHRELFSQNGLEFEVVDTGHPLYLNADPTRVAQMIGNLLGNSAKFTPRGGRTTLSLETDAQGNARIRVRDNGMGVAPETLNHIFEPFVQADRTLHRSSGGLGLGLALVKGLAELHGGQAYAHSEGLGKGAEFVISLPLQEQPASLGPSMAAQDEPNRKLRVLIIEDNLDTAESLREVLALGGHEVALAYDGFEGVSLARQFKPHVIFCDIGLPGKNGLAIAREIRAEPELAHVALFAVSGYAQPEDVESAKQAGFDAHLSKPPTIAALERALASSVRHLG